MTQLSAQSIRGLCELAKNPLFKLRNLKDGYGNYIPMISPFISGRRVLDGKSYGLSSASYDCRIASKVELGRLAVERQEHPHFALANTIENFAIPHSVAGFVVDKSSYARVFVSAFNTLLDPGFIGNLTLELVNLSNKPVIIPAGAPICQIVFHFLDQPTDLPYTGKYQNQEPRPQPAIRERDT